MINEHPLLASYSNIFVIVRVKKLKVIILDVPFPERTLEVHKRYNLLMENIHQNDRHDYLKDHQRSHSEVNF